MSLLSWGTWVGWGLFAFAFVAHVTSALDALRQGSFPVFPGGTAVVVTPSILGLLFYLPAALALSIVALPGVHTEGTERGYLVNCWAYRSAKPRIGEWIWMRLPFGEPRAGKIVAMPGQEVEWNGRNWRIDGQDRPLHGPMRLNGWPQTCRFRVPESQVLVEPEDMGTTSPPAGPLVLVAPEAIIGRAWAQYYPVWERRLL
jgi:hypothetical protein